MKPLRQMSLTDKTKWRIRMLWAILVLMILYMVFMGEWGFGDSRIMTPLAQRISKLIFFGGFAWAIYRIGYHKRLLKNHTLLVEQHLEHQDERRQFLHDKSGGLVVDVLLAILLFTTCTAALINMPAFYLSFGILICTIALKAICYAVYQARC